MSIEHHVWPDALWTVACNRCNTTESAKTRNAADAGKILGAFGWEEIGEDLHCPRCVEAMAYEFKVEDLVCGQSRQFCKIWTPSRIVSVGKAGTIYGGEYEVQEFIPPDKSYWGTYPFRVLVLRDPEKDGKDKPT